MAEVLPWSQLLRHLVDAFAQVFPDEAAARAFVGTTPVDPHKVAFSPRAETNWYNILTEARRQGMIMHLVFDAQLRYGDVLALVAACQDYRAWHAAGGPLTEREERLDRIEVSFRLAPGDVSGSPVAPTLRALSDSVIDKHRPFGGRLQELDWLDHFVAGSPAAYKLITGPAGYGKSALLANWVRDLQARTQPVIYHFFRRDRDHLATEADVLQNLCEQLGAFAGLHGLLPLNPATLRNLYGQLLTLPLDGAAGRLTVVLDGLDEAVDWNPAADLFPAGLPAGVHVVFSARQQPGVDWLDRLGLSSAEVDPLILGGLDDAGLADLLASAGGAAAGYAADADFRRRLLQASRGDPFDCYYRVQDIVAGDITADNVEQAPKGVDNYLKGWLAQLTADVEIDSDVVYDLLGILSVARGRLRPDVLGGMAGSLKKGMMLKKVLAGRLSRYLSGDESIGYAINQERFSRYLAETQFNPAEVTDYRAKVIDFCAAWDQYVAGERQKRRYALTHYAGHLVDAAAAETDASKRGEILATLVELLTGAAPGGFRQAYVAELNDLPALQADLERGLAAVAAYDQPAAKPLVVRMGLAFARFRNEEVSAAALFDLAARGQPAAARDRLRLFDASSDWQQASLLIAAWLARDHDEAAAAAWRDQVVPQRPAAPPLQTLWDWLAHALGEGLAPQGELPPPPHVEEAEAIRDRLAGSGSASAEFLHRHQLLIIEDEMVGERGYLALDDGPKLVAYALAAGAAGGRYLDDYIAVHAQSNYIAYRQRSLFLLLDAIVRHPLEEWVLRYARKVAEAALGRGEEVSLVALEAARTEAEARAAQDDEVFEAARLRAYEAAAPLVDDGGPGAVDKTGEHKRRLAAYAETLAVAWNAHDIPPLDELLDRAMRLRYGYAGYGAPAYLALAETMRICRPDRPDQAFDATRKALEAAHNINDDGFCAAMTARMNAMAERWPAFAPIPAAAEAIRRLVRDRAAPEFAALHRVGEEYEGRLMQFRLRMPGQWKAANTLRELADAYGRPLSEVQRVNPELAGQPDFGWPPGTLIRIPDPGLAPLIAARLAAEVLAQGGSAAEKRRLIQSLAPVAAPDPAALVTVLGRLILADLPVEVMVL